MNNRRNTLLEINRLYNQDCFELLPLIDDNSINLIIADLPYAGYTQNKWDTKDFNFEGIWKEWRRILSKNGTILFFGAGIFFYEQCFKNKDLYVNDIVWEKPNVTGFLNSHCQPLRNHEQIGIFSNGTASPTSKNKMVYNPQMWEGLPYETKSSSVGGNNYNTFARTPKVSDGKRYPKSVWKRNNAVAQKDNRHPTEKPLGLLRELILTFSNENDLVLDPTCGTGNSMLGSKLENRNWIGIEMDKRYYEIAKNKLEKELENCSNPILVPVTI